jgi:fatty acid amide hydrolase 2
MDPLLSASAVKLAQLIRRREVSSREVVQAHVRHAREVNPILNAIVDERFDAALADAERADLEVKRNPEGLGPFHGVPCTIKECLSLAGLRTTSGLLARRDHVATVDGVAVARLKRAGAIPLGVTNVSELMMWMESSNPIYGRTNNPYNPRHIVGGSSGGEGAIVGAGASPFGLGSDIGGSIRMPAFFCGVFGHKPSGGLVPATGHWPMAEGPALRYLTTGPLARRAEDLMPFVRAVAGPDGSDDGCRPFELGDPAAVRLDELTVWDVEDNGGIAVSADLRQAQRDVASHLASLGARVEPLRIPELKQSFEVWSAMMDEAAKTRFSEHLGHGGARVRAGRELLAFLFGRRKHTLPSLLLALTEPLPALLPKLQQQAIALAHKLRRELPARLGPRGIILYPPFPTPAPRHHRPLTTPFHFQYAAIFNILEFAVTVVPLGLNAEGLPLGVQVASVPGNDHVTIAVALELERRFGGWVMPALRTRARA